MYPRQFEYVAPSSLDEALGALGDGSKVMAGGMSLIPLMKTRLFSPSVVVDIGRIPGLDAVSDEGDYISVPALVRHGTTASDAAHRHPCRRVGYRGVAHRRRPGAQPRHDLRFARPLRRGRRSTGGGDRPRWDDDRPICLRNEGDPGFGVLRRRPDLRTRAGRDPGRDPAPEAGPGEASAYDKLGRRGGHSDYAVAGAAAWVKKSNGTVEDARVGLTGVGTKPTLALGVANAIVGTDGSDEAVKAAAEHALEDVTVLEDLYGSEEYKTHLAKVFVARALKQAIAAV